MASAEMTVPTMTPVYSDQSVCASSAAVSIHRSRSGGPISAVSQSTSSILPSSPRSTFPAWGSPWVTTQLDWSARIGSTSVS